MMTVFKDTFGKVCNLPDQVKEELDIVENFQCNSIEGFDKGYKKAVADAHRAIPNPKDTQQYKEFSDQIDKMSSESHTIQNVDTAPSRLALAEDIEVEEQNVLEMIDPISKMPITHPVRNKICNHIYDEATIKESIQKAAMKANAKLRCPYLGCGNKKSVTLEDLVSDDMLRRKIFEARSQMEITLPAADRSDSEEMEESD